MSRKQSPKRTKKPRAEDIDPSLLPPEMTHVGPHDPIATYFSNEDHAKVVEQWADFYEKRPAEGSRELVDAVIRIAGAEYELTEQQVKKQEFESVESDIQAILEESTETSVVQNFLDGRDTLAHDFWFDIGNGLIVCKGLYNDSFDVFKTWVTRFCDSCIRPLRQAATVAVLSLTEFLADSIMKSSEGAEKLKKSKDKSALKDRQRRDFEAEGESAKELSMEFFTTVIKQRFTDIDTSLRTVCINATAKIIDMCPEQFENGNFMKYIGSALQDDSAKVKKEALKASEGILERLDDEDDNKSSIQTFFKRNIPNIISLCEESDNGIVIPAFNLLNELAKRNLIKDFEDTESIFRLTADDSANVRNSAAKFFAKAFFTKKVKKSEQQELYENQIRKFAELCGDMSEGAILNSVEAHWRYVKALQEFELMVQILISADSPKDSAIFAYILCACATVASSKKNKTVADMTTSIVGHFKDLQRIYGKFPDVILALVRVSQFFDLNAIEQAAGIRQMKEFLKAFHTLFTKSTDDDIFLLITRSLSKWKRDPSTPKKIGKEIAIEIDSIVKEYSAPGKDVNKFKKLLAILEFIDLSDNKKLRTLLNETASNGDDELSAIALQCIEKIFKWDVMRIRNDEDQCKEYEDTFNEFYALATSKLHFDDNSVKEAAFKLTSTIISLAKLITHEPLDEADTAIFFKQFHTLEHKEELFDFLVRPIQCNSVDPKFAVHIMWYLQDAKLKPRARSFITANSGLFPLENGSELSELIRTQKYTQSHLKQAMKVMAKKINPLLVIDAWLDEPDDSLIPIYAPFLELLKSDDVYTMLSRATGTIKDLLKRISNGEKLTAKDFVIKKENKKGKSKNDDDEGSDEEEEEESNEDDDEADNESD